MATMRALIRDAGGVALRRVPAPVPVAPDDVVIAVAIAGVCRTDLRVADGELGVAPVVLGHEAAGTIVSSGEPVTIVPFAACGDCAGCTRGACLRPRWLGVDRDGVFAELVCVPAAQVRRLPAAMPMRHGAYVEPVAAALGAARGLAPGARVLVRGRNRIAELTARVLATHGAIVLRDAGRDTCEPGRPESAAATCEPGRPESAAAAFASQTLRRSGLMVDVVVESDGGPLALDALRPGGTLILKTRGAPVTTIDPAVMVARELTVRGAGHGSFDDAIAWLDAHGATIDDLLAPPRPLDEFAAVLADARASEAQKLLFACAG